MTMMLQYVPVAQADLAVKFQAASPMGHLLAWRGPAPRRLRGRLGAAPNNVRDLR
jgi:hypothetical protein